MDILLLTQLLPWPPDSGGKIKLWHRLRLLAERHRVTLVSFVRPGDAVNYPRLDALCAATHYVPLVRRRLDDVLFMARSVVQRQPFVMLRDDRRAMRAVVDGLGCFDLVIADQLNMAQYAVRVRADRRLLDNHDALWLLYQRQAATARGPLRLLWQHEWRLLRRYEGAMCRRFDHVLAVSAQDRAALLAAGARDVTVVPIGVDTQALTPVARAADADHILHVGTMYWPPNAAAVAWFLAAVWPQIVAARPASVCDLVGKNPPAELVRQAAALPGVNLPGYVEDLAATYARCGVYIVPLRAGGGMRVKILNALALGLPIVSTPLGCEGIDVVDGEHVLLADEPAAFAAAVLRVLGDPALAARLGVAGRQLAVERYDYRVTQRPLEALL